MALGLVLALVLVYILVLIWWFFIRSDDVDDIRALAGELPSSMPETTQLTTSTVTITPPPAPKVVFPVVIPEPMIELYSGLNFTGRKKVLFGGMRTEVCQYTSAKTMAWSYRSMKITPGARFYFINTVSGGKHITHAVGKYNVPDMWEFIKSWDKIYKEGRFDRDYWARPFLIELLKPNETALKEYHECMKGLMSTGVDGTNAGRRCFNNHPDQNLPFTA